MSEVDMLRAALGVLATVIGVLFRFLLKLDQRLQAKNEQIIQFARELLSKGDPCEVLEKVARILKETERKESPGTMGRDDHPAGDGAS